MTRLETEAATQRRQDEARAVQESFRQAQAREAAKREAASEQQASRDMATRRAAAERMAEPVDCYALSKYAEAMGHGFFEKAMIVGNAEKNGRCTWRHE